MVVDRNYNIAELPSFQEANNKLNDNILGEYDCVVKVRNYDFHNMPVKQEELKDLKPLLELADYVDNFHKAKHS